MRVADGWRDYALLDASDGERLERWGEYILIRPDPQVLWRGTRKDPRWQNAHARYVRSSEGGGRWERRKPLPDSWQISYGDLRFYLKPMGFKHTGLFPEQAVNWDFLREVLARGDAAKIEKVSSLRVLNLFGYTGAASLACAKAGAAVTHVDAAKGMVAWGRENAAASDVTTIRWLVDDCAKFVAREQRRGSRYDAILMDPPSYGRGPNGEVWKLEEQIYGLIKECAALLSDGARLFLINSYAAGLSPSVMAYMLGLLLPPGRVWADEIGLPVAATGLILPCGATAVWERE
ncbi:MAG: class I SAM-dependent methyltransferase [Oscillospiraceae bacterium]|nr:class I SAM-dependent methyltransferase [Oscillospiraceae bacterium]